MYEQCCYNAWTVLLQCMNSDNCLMYNKSMWFYCSCVEKKKKKEEGNGEIENVDIQ